MCGLWDVWATGRAGCGTCGICVGCGSYTKRALPTRLCSTQICASSGPSGVGAWPWGLRVLWRHATKAHACARAPAHCPRACLADGGGAARVGAGAAGEQVAAGHPGGEVGGAGCRVHMLGAGCMRACCVLGPLGCCHCCQPGPPCLSGCAQAVRCVREGAGCLGGEAAAAATDQLSSNHHKRDKEHLSPYSPHAFLWMCVRPRVFCLAPSVAAACSLAQQLLLGMQAVCGGGSAMCGPSHAGGCDHRVGWLWDGWLSLVVMAL